MRHCSFLFALSREWWTDCESVMVWSLSVCSNRFQLIRKKRETRRAGEYRMEDKRTNDTSNSSAAIMRLVHVTDNELVATTTGRRWTVARDCHNHNPGTSSLAVNSSPMCHTHAHLTPTHTHALRTIVNNRSATDTTPLPSCC